MNRIDEFLRAARPGQNIKALTELAGLPVNALIKHFDYLEGKRSGRRLAVAHYLRIVRAMVVLTGSVKIGEWFLYAGDESHLLYGVRPLGGESDEYDEPNNTFASTEQRSVWDASDFHEFFE